ncbi:T9SS type A sorting domain-containing protein [Crocinitomix catalasitica]|uniref:T9SS type A sorting domain-containing protein n=1 Tax=Crocinitomix catalasitica TaxID=184607 RepID=UPI0004833140|nr:T9SS type A sorting domain-containing protein [Crocinitomix catalasitica]
MKLLLLFFFSLISVTSVFAQFSDEIELINNIRGEYTSVNDLDNDGDIDVVLGGEESLVWKENLGEGNFSQNRIISTNIYRNSLFTVHDLDEDGYEDIISFEKTGMPSRQLLVYFKNNGDGTFADSIIIGEVPGTPKAVDIGDVDNDGFLDVLVAQSAGRIVSVFKTEGSPLSWVNSTIIEYITIPYDGQLLDMDEDGDLDVLFNFVAPGDASAIRWYENLDDGNFSADPVWSEGGVDYPRKSIYKDVDNDGLKDIVSTSTVGENKIVWNKNLGTGEFSDLALISDDVLDPLSVSVGDIDNDGDNDVLSISVTDQKVALYRNLGDGVFDDQEVLFSELPYPQTIDLADFDNDGNLDIMVSYKYEFGEYNVEQPVVWFKNLGGGSFDGSYNYISINTYRPEKLDVFDIDGDGLDDVLAIDFQLDKVYWYKNHGDLNFQLKEIISDDFDEPVSACAGDFDNDGDIDIAVCEKEGAIISWFENTGDGNFGDKQILVDDAEDGKDIECYDINGDGYLELLSLDFDKLSVIFNDAGEFRDYIYEYDDMGSMTTFELVDIDADGNVDLIYTHGRDNEVRWRKNNGYGLFRDPQAIATGVSYDAGIHYGDINGDGLMDVVVGFTTGVPVKWYENLGDLGFGDANILYSEHTDPKIVQMADLDNDGDPDLLIGGANYPEDDALVWLENLGDATFGEPQSISNSHDLIREILASDLDNDGDFDVLVSSYWDQSIAIYENYQFSPNQIRGKVFIDLNENGTEDLDEIGTSMLEVISDPDYSYAFTYEDGDYIMIANSDVIETYAISLAELEHWHITTDPSIYSVEVDEYFTYEDSVDFGIYFSEVVDEVENSLSGDFPRCNTIVNYWIDINNVGTTNPSGIITMKLDENVAYISSEVEPDSIVDQQIFWSYESLAYFGRVNFNVQVELPDFSFMGDTLSSLLITSIDESDYVANDTLNQILVCAYDPNDKSVTPKGVEEMGLIPPTTPSLEYIIRFQNTGTDTARNVVIVDQLDPNLDWSSLRPVSWSDPMEIVWLPSGEISFRFENIMLPDSNVNELASHGFVKFKIDLIEGLDIGTEIHNYAKIYFDENPAIITNTTLNTLYVEEFDNILENESSQLRLLVYPNPFSNFTTIYFGEELKGESQLKIYNLLGKEVYSMSNLKGSSHIFENKFLSPGVYLITLTTSNMEAGTVKIVIQ